MTQEAAKDFFISYNQADRAWAEWIAWKLEEAGYTTILQAWDFAPGSNFVVNMHNAARLARRTIALLSPDYLKSRYAQSEWAAAFVQDPTGEKDILLPVLVRSCELDGLLASIGYIDLTGLDETTAQATLLAKIKATRARPSVAPGFPGKASAAVDFPGKKAVVWNIPYPRNPFFTGRDKLLEDVHKRFTTQKAVALTQAISGLGGIGKTQIAIEYAYRYEHEYRYVLWANAASSESLLNDFVSLAALLNAPGYDPQQQLTAVKAVQQWLATQKDWLLILDNADDIAMVRGYLPTRSNPGGHVLLTTRAQATRAIAQPFEVDKMEKDEGILLLLRRTGVIESAEQLSQAPIEDRNAAEAIVVVLDGLPLALDQAGGYIEEVGCSLADYLQLYQTHRKELLSKESQLSAAYPEMVATTWSLAFQRIEQANPAAAALLQFCAFLAPDVIPEKIITMGAGDLGDVIEPVATNAFKLNEVLGTLQRYSLLRRDSETKVLTIHRLVQAVLQDTLALATQELWATRVIMVVERVFTFMQSANWSQVEQYMPQAYACVELIEQYKLFFPAAGIILLLAGSHLQNYARYKDAEKFYQEAIDIFEDIWETEHFQLAVTVHKLGQIYEAQQQYQKAEKMYQRALNIFENISEDENDEFTMELRNGALASILHRLGHVYQMQELYQEAKASYQQGLKLCMKSPEVEAREALVILHDLATLHEEQGYYQKEEGLYKYALEVYENEQLRNSEDIEVLNTLAKLYGESGRYHEAEALYLRALNICERNLGAEHPSTAQTLHQLARHRRGQGRFEEASELYLRALDIYEKLLGPEHGNVAATLYYLAELRRQQKRDSEAEALLQRALAIREKVLGPEHQSTAAILHELARLYEDQGKYEVSERLYLRVLRIYEKVLGAEHNDIAMTLHELARIYNVQHRYEELEQVELRALAIHEKVLGEHQFTYATLYRLAKLYHAQDNYERAASYYQRALAIQEKEPGIQHPDTIKTISDYAALLRAMGRESEAAGLEARIK